MLTKKDVTLLSCPKCQGELAFEGQTQTLESKEEALDFGTLLCDACRIRYCVDKGMARLFVRDNIKGSDRLARLMYDMMPGLHDYGVRYVLPLWGGGTEDEIRSGYLPLLDLPALKGAKKPIRILEVSIGTGSNMSLLYKNLPPGLAVEIWGLDLSIGMLHECQKKIQRKNLRSPDGSHIRLMMADAHALPFPDGVFDRVFHVGGIAAFGDPAQAIQEMARVAKTDTPIVLVDEALDPKRKNNVYHRAMFRMLTAHDSDPHPPREYLPFEAKTLADKQVSRFYYALAFQMPKVTKKKKSGSKKVA